MEIIETEPGYFTVIVDGEFADKLTRDEALGVVASALFSSRKPLFVRSYEAWHRYHQKFGPRPQKPIALLSCGATCNG